MIFLEKK